MLDRPTSFTIPPESCGAMLPRTSPPFRHFLMAIQASPTDRVHGLANRRDASIGEVNHEYVRGRPWLAGSQRLSLE